jgi:hypothetical protein
MSPPKANNDVCICNFVYKICQHRIVDRIGGPEHTQHVSMCKRKHYIHVELAMPPNSF